MALFTKDLYEVSDNKIYKISCMKRQRDIGIDEIKKNNHHKKVFIISGEEIYIKYLNLPRVKNDILEKLVKDELESYYRGREDIIFSYIVLNKNQKNLDLIVFYINSRKLRNIEIANIYNIKGIYLIQFIYLRYVNKIVSFSNYILAFMYEKNLYLIYCKNGVLRSNLFQKEFKNTELELKKSIYNFFSINNIDEKLIEKIITTGFSFKISGVIQNEISTMDIGLIEKSNLYKAIG